MSDSDEETMPSSDMVHKASKGGVRAVDADTGTEIGNIEVSEAEKSDITRVNDVHNTVQEHNGSGDTDGLPYSPQQKDSKDNVDFIKKNVTELNDRQSDESFSADPIDLVLQEIGEQVTSVFCVFFFFVCSFVRSCVRFFVFFCEFFRAFFIFFL